VTPAPISSAAPARKRGGGVWVAVILGGLVAFAAAGAGAYVLDELVRHGSP
jgi:hypothetical protein